MIRFVVRGGLAASAVMLMIATLTALTPALAAGTLAGSGQIVDGAGQPLTSGDSDTDFSIKLPTGASCPGDSTNDGYRWQTYMVSEAIDESALQFGNTGPTGGSLGTAGSFKQPLYTTTGSAVAQKQTADKTPPDTRGPILDVPLMDFAVFVPGDIPAGVYDVGVACTVGPASTDQMKDFWNLKLTVATAAAGQGGPAEITWTAADAPTTTTTSTTTVGDTTTTIGGNTTTTVANTTTTLVSGTSTSTSTPASTSTSTTAAGGATTSTTRPAGAVGSGGLVRTGGPLLPIAQWGAALIIFGLLARRLRQPRSGAHF